MEDQSKVNLQPNPSRKRSVYRDLSLTILVTAILCLSSWQLFVAFGRANIFGFGGGPGSIPLIRQEVVTNFHWLTNAEFTDALAMGNALPGPIATKMAAYVGYKIHGVLGVLVSLAATVIPAVLLMLGLGGLYLKYKDKPQVMGMLKTVRPVVVVLLAETTWEMGKGSFPVNITWIIALITAVLTFRFKLHPVILIIAAMLFGSLFLGQ